MILVGGVFSPVSVAIAVYIQDTCGVIFGFVWACSIMYLPSIVFGYLCCFGIPFIIIWSQMRNGFICHTQIINNIGTLKENLLILLPESPFDIRVHSLKSIWERTVVRMKSKIAKEITAKKMWKSTKLSTKWDHFLWNTWHNCENRKFLRSYAVF